MDLSTPPTLLCTAPRDPVLQAVFVAVKDKMDLSIAVALGSSIQIAVFLIPAVVLTGWATGRDFTLDFDAFAVLMLTGEWVVGGVGVGGGGGQGAGGTGRQGRQQGSGSACPLG